MNLTTLKSHPRILIEAELKPLQSVRFQPTGFPHLGAAEFDAPNSSRMLLVESPQSIANHLEKTLFREFTRDTVSEELADAVSGLPYVLIDLGEFGSTNTLLEAHRLNSAYIWENSDDSAARLQSEILRSLGIPSKRKKKEDADDSASEGNEVSGAIDLKKFYKTLLRYDPNSLLHGVFLEKVAGRLRLPRCVSGFIEATGVQPIESGGVKNDHVFPKKDEANGITSRVGFTNVPFSRTEYSAVDIRAYFDIDISLIRGLGLGDTASDLLITLALFKIRRFLDQGLRLRSACSLELSSDWACTRPIGISLPTMDSIQVQVRSLIDRATAEGLFASPSVSSITWSKNKKSGEKLIINLPIHASAPNIPVELAGTVKWKKKSKARGPVLEISGGHDSEVLGVLTELFAGDDESIAAIAAAAQVSMEALPPE